MALKPNHHKGAFPKTLVRCNNYLRDDGKFFYTTGHWASEAPVETQNSISRCKQQEYILSSRFHLAYALGNGFGLRNAKILLHGCFPMPSWEILLRGQKWYSNDSHSTYTCLEKWQKPGIYLYPLYFWEWPWKLPAKSWEIIQWFSFALRWQFPIVTPHLSLTQCLPDSWSTLPEKTQSSKQEDTVEWFDIDSWWVN